MEQNIPPPKLVMVRGLPGSGKSFISDILAKKIGTDVIVLDPDRLNTEDPAFKELSRSLSEDGLDESIHPFRWLRKQACEGVVAGHTVIWNQPFTHSGVFERLVEFIRSYAADHEVDVPVLLIEVEIDETTAKQRISDRKKAGGHGPVEAVFNKRAEEYESLAGRFHSVVVKGDSDIDETIDKILVKLQEL